MNKQFVLTQLTDCMEEIRQRFSVRRLSVFGSVVRDEASDSSDVDVLVVFDRPATFDIFMDLKFYLEELLGMGVDLVTDKALRPQIRRAIEQEMVDVA
jgi:predicted nucleotidyltransferase